MRLDIFFQGGEINHRSAIGPKWVKIAEIKLFFDFEIELRVIRSGKMNRQELRAAMVVLGHVLVKSTDVALDQLAGLISISLLDRLEDLAEIPVIFL